jgi:subtilisin family serine protease
MSGASELGSYLWRGGKRVELEREEEVFTAIVDNQAELDRIRSLPGVSTVEPVRSGVFKVQVDAKQRDSAMEHYRSEECDGICHHAYRPVGNATTRYYVTDNILAKFATDAPVERIEEILAESHVRVVREYPGGDKTFLLQVGSDAGMNPIKVANRLAEYDEVVYSEPNLVNRYNASHTPTDTRFSDQWHLRAQNGVELVAEADVSATDAWDVTRGEREVVVAVLDDGFDLSHPDFQGTGKVVHAKDFFDGDSNPFPESSEGDYHGTPCAGVAIAEENGEGVVGIAPRCAFMPVRFSLGADDNELFDIFDFIGKRADVISCSWGPVPVFAPQSQLLADKFTELSTTGGRRKKGCVICFAAGNYNAPLNDPNNTDFRWRTSGPVRRTTGPILNGEASHPNVVAVAASTSQNLKAAYSNWGAEISVCAPSNNFHPLDRFATVPGRGVVTTDNEQFGDGFTTGSRFTNRFGGTSSATPLVAGIAGLVISANRNLTGPEVKQILEETADKIIDDNTDPILGNAFGTYDGSGRSQWFGFGKVNAAAAVKRARELAQDDQVVALDMAVSSEGSLNSSGSTQLYRVHVGSTLKVILNGPEGEDFDLYVKRGSAPTTDDFDGRGFSGTSNENVEIAGVEQGDYYIMVRSYRGAGDYSLLVDLD